MFRAIHLATLTTIWHIWEGRSQQVSVEEPDLRFVHGNCWTFISHAVWKPCFATGGNPGFPDTCGAAGPTLKSRCKSLPMHPRMKYFRKRDPRWWLCWMAPFVWSLRSPDMILSHKLFPVLVWIRLAPHGAISDQIAWFSKINSENPISQLQITRNYALVHWEGMFPKMCA